jgi:hypothetical protein
MSNLIFDIGAAIGMSKEEITWLFERLKYLIHVEKKSKTEARAITKEEAKGKPWLRHSTI